MDTNVLDGISGLSGISDTPPPDNHVMAQPDNYVMASSGNGAEAPAQPQQPQGQPQASPAPQSTPQPSTQPQAVPPDVPHARLANMLQGLFVGMGAFAQSAATGGREGGPAAVQDFYAKQQQMQLQKQAAQRELNESQSRMQHTQALTNMTIAQTELLKMNAPLEHQNLAIENQAKLYDLYVNKMHINPMFVVPIVQGQTTDTQMNAINQKAGGDLVNNTVIPVHDSTVGGSGNSYGFGYDQLRKVNLPIEQAQPVLNNLQNQINFAKSVLPNGADDPGVKAAQGKLDLMQKGKTVNGYDFFVFDNQVQSGILARTANNKAVSDYQKDLAESQTAQEKAKAETRPKNLDDAQGRAVQAQLDYQHNPSVQTKQALSDATAQLQGFRRLEVSKTYADASARVQAQRVADQQDLKIVAHQMATDPNNLTVLKDVASMRGDQRIRLFSMIKQENPNYDTGVAQNKLRFVEKFTDPNSKTQQNIASYNTFMEHAGDAVDAVDNYRNTNLPLINTPINQIRNKFGDAEFSKFAAALSPVASEYTNFLKAGYAPSVEDIKEGKDLLNTSMTPAQLEVSLKQMGHTALRRADSINQEYRTVMGGDYPNLITPDAKDSANKLGLGDQVGKFGSGGRIGQGKFNPAALPDANSVVPVPAQKFNPNTFPVAH